MGHKSRRHVPLVVNKDAINKTLFGETRAPSALLYNPPHAFLALRHSHTHKLARLLALSHALQLFFFRITRRTCLAVEKVERYLFFLIFLQIMRWSNGGFVFRRALARVVLSVIAKSFATTSRVSQSPPFAASLAVVV